MIRSYPTTEQKNRPDEGQGYSYPPATQEDTPRLDAALRADAGFAHRFAHLTDSEQARIAMAMSGLPMYGGFRNNRSYGWDTPFG